MLVAHTLIRGGAAATRRPAPPVRTDARVERPENDWRCRLLPLGGPETLFFVS